MTLTIAQLEDALWCAHKAKEHFYMTANSERADRIIVALEAEIELMKEDGAGLKIKGGQACAWGHE